MATTNLITRSHGDIVFQHGNGTPDHASPLGSEYVDLDTGLHYTNTGGTSWGGGVSGDLLSTNNLSDVVNAAAALSNLNGETAFSKNTAFNKDFGTTAGTVLEGNTTTISGAESTKLGHLTVTQPVDLDTIESDVSTNNAKTTNATHTGEVTGSGSLTVDSTAISNKTSVTAASGMEILVNDAGTLKKADASDFLGGGGDTYYVQKDTNNGGGTVDAPFDSMVELVPSSGDFEITVSQTGSYMVYISVGISTDLNKDNNALQLMWGLNGSLGGGGNDDARRNGQYKKNRRNGIQGTWINVSLTVGDVVTAFLSTCDDSCTWENGRMWIALWQ